MKLDAHMQLSAIKYRDAKNLIPPFNIALELKLAGSVSANQVLSAEGVYKNIVTWIELPKREGKSSEGCLKAVVKLYSDIEKHLPMSDRVLLNHEISRTRSQQLPPYTAVTRKAERAISRIVCSFVHEWSPLGLFPTVPMFQGHVGPDGQNLVNEEGADMGTPLRWFTTMLCEDVEAYLQFAKQTVALLSVAAYLRLGVIPNDRVSELAYHQTEEESNFPEIGWRKLVEKHIGINGHKVAMFQAINLWLDSCPLGLHLDFGLGTIYPIVTIKALPTAWDACRFYNREDVLDYIHHIAEIEGLNNAESLSNEFSVIKEPIRPSRLYAAVGLELFAAMTGTSGCYICDICGQPFVAKDRKPRAGSLKVCSPYCRSEANRIKAKRSYDKKQTEGSKIDNNKVGAE
ncbi:MAG: hypothetical protein ABJA67_17825 [Chthonomonadales bacterium]